MAGEPRPNRPKGLKRSAAALYRYLLLIGFIVCLISQSIHQSLFQVLYKKADNNKHGATKTNTGARVGLRSKNHFN